jgi:hypothetical protein
MNEKEIREIMEPESRSSNAENQVMSGLNLLQKYFPGRCIEGAEHDIIFCQGIDELVKANIAVEDVMKLHDWWWFIDEDSDCLAHFV